MNESLYKILNFYKSESEIGKERLINIINAALYTIIAKFN